MHTGPVFGNCAQAIRALVLAVLLGLALAGCSVNGGPSSNEAQDGASAAADEGGEGADTNAAQASANDPANNPAPLPPPTDPVEMAETGWAANDSDGVIYTTFIDPDGTYRDFRDGVRYQIGSWDMPGSNRLCYRPDDAIEESGADDGGRTCWTVRPPGRDGVMIAVDSDGREVKVRRVKYVPPEEE